MEWLGLENPETRVRTRKQVDMQQYLDALKQLLKAPAFGTDGAKVGTIKCDSKVRGESYQSLRRNFIRALSMTDQATTIELVFIAPSKEQPNKFQVGWQKVAQS